jgi:hypothetical protein
MEIAMQDDVLKVRASSPNGAAAKAGLTAGDIITHVDDTPINGLNFAQVQAKLRGQVDTPARLKIVHRGQDTPVDVTVIREMIRIPGVQLTAPMEDGRLVIEPSGPFPVLDFDAGKPVCNVDRIVLPWMHDLETDWRADRSAQLPLYLSEVQTIDRLLKHLKLRIAPRRHVVAERIDAFGRSADLIFLDQICDAGELHLWHWQPEVVVDSR